MPFNALPAMSAHACTATSHHPVPTGAARPGAAPSAGPDTDTLLLRLDLMPPEILVRIAAYLPANDALAFGRGSRRILEALRRDVVEPLRLGERIQWVNSLTGMQAAIDDALAAPEERRRPLLRALVQRAQFLHPQLQEPARQRLAPYREAPAKPWWDGLYAPTDPARQRFSQPDGHGELLARVLASPPHAQVRLLLRWFGDAHADSPPAPTADRWERIVSALPPNARGQVLTVMASAIPEDNTYDRAQAIVLAAVREAADPGEPVPAGLADALTQLAERLVQGAPEWEPARIARSWEEIYSLACRLPLHCQPKVLSALTEFVNRDGVDPAGDRSQLRPRWLEFIGYVRSHLMAADVALVLGSLVENSGEDRDVDRLVREAVVQAAGALPDEWRATLLARVVRYGMYGLTETLAAWDEAFLAAASLPPANAAPVYNDLANAIHDLRPDMAVARWHALARRLETAGKPDTMLPALLEMAHHGLVPLEPQQRVVLARLGTRLSVKDRSLLSASMAAASPRTPQTWHMQMTELEELPRQARLAPAWQLAVVLFHYPAGGAFASAPDELAPDPGALRCARMPGTLTEALSTLSEILTLLPLAHRGAVLLALSPMQSRGSAQPIPWSPPRACWLLEEALKLAPLQHHGIGVVANVLTVVAQRCASEADARSMLPLLEGAVRALPADARASPLFWLGSLIQRLLNDKPTRDRWLAELAALPREDADIASADSRKRKGAPE